MVAVEYVQSRLPMLMVAAFLLLASACDKSGGGAPTGDPTGEARIAIVNAPNDVRCIRVNAAGTRVVTSSFSVMAADPTVFTLRGLPRALVTFPAHALRSLCPPAYAGTLPTPARDSVTTRSHGGAT